MLERLPLLSSRKTQKSFDLPSDYVITKFYELGYKVTYNRYGNVYKCCCPLCKEGKSWGKKKRCFYIPEHDNIYCHNCGASMTPYNWIRQVSGMSDEELELDVENNQSFVEYSFENDNTPRITPTLPDDSINLFDPIQLKFYSKDHIVQTALAYIKRRRLDTAINAPDALYLSRRDYTHKNRLIIPFKSSSGKIIFYQSRKLFEWDDKTDYLSKYDSDKSIFGIDHVDSSINQVFIFEGPIDSCFMKNGVAVGGINEGHHRFTPTQSDQLEELKFYEKIWVLDSQWKDETAQKKTLVLLEMGEKVFIWPRNWGVRYKDFNEICTDQGIDGISSAFVLKNSQCGVSAALKFKMILSKIN